MALKSHFRYEYEITARGGQRKWVLEMGQGVFDENGRVNFLEGIVIDITEQKAREAQIHHMMQHDSLTGLYNRRFFEEEKTRLDDPGFLPLVIIIFDINGVRLINDAFGNAHGDRIIIETARIIKSCCRKGDVVARTEGGEFRILLPNTNSQTANELLEKIMSACEEYNKALNSSTYCISLSVGCGMKETAEASIDRVIKEAEDNLYKNKLLNRKSFHNSILSSIMTTMYARSHETEEHAERIAALSKTIGEKLALPQKSLDELDLLSMLHDIGKAGIDDSVLNKPGKLNDEEWAIMKKHPEIGYRIAMAIPDLEHIAEYILYHHERWDGKGYPQGLQGEDIPLLSRILAVTDAYDAMIEDRVYRKAMTKEEALAEIKRNSGTQFDPRIVEIITEITGQS